MEIFIRGGRILVEEKAKLSAYVSTFSSDEGTPVLETWRVRLRLDLLIVCKFDLLTSYHRHISGNENDWRGNPKN